MKKFHAVLMLLGLVALACMTWNIGAKDLWQKLASLGWGLIPLMLAEGLGEMVHTLGWRHCLSNAYQSVPFIHLFRIRMAGYAINYLTPTATLGGEATKATLLALPQRVPEAVSSVLMDKVCLAIGHLLLVVAGGVVILWRIQLPRPVWLAMVISSALVAIGVVAFLLLQKHGKLGILLRWLAARQVGGPMLQKAAGYMTEVDETMKSFYREHPQRLLWAICWHVLGNSVGVVQTWLYFSLLNQNASMGMAASAWFLGLWFDLAVFFMPLNLGTLEGGRILAFKVTGFDALLGMTYGVMLRLGQLLWCALGLVNYGMLALEPPRQAPGAKALSEAG